MDIRQQQRKMYDTFWRWSIWTSVVIFVAVVLFLMYVFLT